MSDPADLDALLEAIDVEEGTLVEWSQGVIEARKPKETP